MVHANDWFDEWQQGCYRTPDWLNIDTFQKLYSKCEDGARKKKLDSDAKNKDAMDIGQVYGVHSSTSWEATGWIDEEGNWWPDDGNWWNEVDGEPQDQEEIDAVNKGKDKGLGPKCYKCGEFGHLARNCKKPWKGKGKGGKGKGYRSTYGGYLSFKGKSGAKKGGKGGGTWQSNYGPVRNFVPHSQRDCYKCGGKGQIAINCPNPGTAANESEPSKSEDINDAGQTTSFGQPLACDIVGMNDESNAPPEPSSNEEVEGQWILPAHERKKAARKVSINLRKAYKSHECNFNCNHVDEWAKRINQCIKQEKSWREKHCEIGLIEMKSAAPEINSVPVQNATHETIVVTVDSGAYNTVGPPKVGTYFPIKHTNASKQGKHYSAANGTTIKNYGQRVITGRNESGNPVSMPIQVAEVNKVLGSVREMVNAGNRVVFDQNSNGKSISHVEHKATGKRTAIYERNGTFQFNIVVPKGPGEPASVKTDSAEGFPRQGTLEADLFY
eukprot:9481258-Pyramimonas_sp.AAC.3